MEPSSASPDNLIDSPLIEGRFATFNDEARSALYSVLRNRLRSFISEEAVQRALNINPNLSLEYIRDTVNMLVFFLLCYSV